MSDKVLSKIQALRTPPPSVLPPAAKIQMARRAAAAEPGTGSVPSPSVSSSNPLSTQNTMTSPPTVASLSMFEQLRRHNEAVCASSVNRLPRDTSTLSPDGAYTCTVSGPNSSGMLGGLPMLVAVPGQAQGDPAFNVNRIVGWNAYGTTTSRDVANTALPVTIVGCEADGGASAVTGDYQTLAVARDDNQLQGVSAVCCFSDNAQAQLQQVDYANPLPVHDPTAMRLDPRDLDALACRIASLMTAEPAASRSWDEFVIQSHSRTCQSCQRTFGSPAALAQHNEAFHKKK